MWAATHLHVPQMNNMLMRMISQNDNYLMLNIVFCYLFNVYCFIFSGAQFAFNPKDVAVQRKNFPQRISNKLTESEIKQQLNRLSQVYANKVSSNHHLQSY